jgi:hypothetical protein
METDVQLFQRGIRPEKIIEMFCFIRGFNPDIEERRTRSLLGRQQCAPTQSM